MGVALCMLLWLVTGRWKTAGIVALLLVPGLFRVSDFYNIDFMREVETKPARSSFTLMSYNVRGFFDDNSRNSVDGVVEYLSQLEDVDIVCFQEFRDMRGVERIDSLFKAKKLAYLNDVQEFDDVTLRTYSRFPIIKSGNISGDNRGTSQWVDVVMTRSIERTSDTIRIFNNHLHTMSITPSDSEEIAQGTILNDGDRMRSIVDRIANNSAIRVDHVDTLRMVVDETPYEHIVCGDFNDTPMSYVYGKLVDKHRDAFVEVGKGYGFTFRPMYGTLRIDYVLHSEGIMSLSYLADDEAEYSDHLPIFVRMKVNKSAEQPK